ncbi:MAG: hypothetical protein KJ963_08810 [Bacteroidetes bacterium]|nr:hypothetical protein [Bacteroidota bacterium]MBU1422647.1 hypothetical protein [Bacteroidota bacterium]MBU2637165.1 hypothetical protein [Bacteroidota bacterium]
MAYRDHQNVLNAKVLIFTEQKKTKDMPGDMVKARAMVKVDQDETSRMNKEISVK